MKPFFSSFTICIFPLMLLSQQTISIRLIQVPPYHASGSAVYLAGSFNGWNPADEKFRMKHHANGTYSIDLSLAKASYEYKITRGGWDRVEAGSNGQAVANRVLQVDADMSLDVKVEEWQDRFPSKPKTSTASKHVCIIDTAFFIPQLKKTRRVWIYLPDDYCDGSNKKYPVLYMHDGQNIFDDATSYSGEWGIDEYFDSLPANKCIVVGIDHGAEKRLNEYNPYDNARFGKAEGDNYVDFIVKTLKPFIDRNYRTKKQKATTFIAGSSMGGLISMYAVLKYPKKFGAAGIFSPAFWIGGSAIYDEIAKRGAKVKSRLYFYGGKLEGDTMVPDLLKAFEAMAKHSSSIMTTVIRDNGQHNEPTWRKEFPLFYQWVTNN